MIHVMSFLPFLVALLLSPSTLAAPKIQKADIVIKGPPAHAASAPAPPSTSKSNVNCKKAGVYVCSDINWSGDCKYYTTCIGSAPENCTVLDGSASSIGPDRGFRCLFYENAFCRADLRDEKGSVLELKYPGLGNLFTGKGWNDRARSFQCFEDK